MNARVRRVQGLRSSNASGVHRSRRRDEDEEPCVCSTGFTCLAELHDDRDEGDGTEA